MGSLQPVDDKNELLKGLLQQMMEVLMEEERTEFLGYPKGKLSPPGQRQTNVRNGYYQREYTSGLGLMANLSVPRDRLGAFFPQLLDILERRSDKVNDLILLMYAKGMTTRDIMDVINEVYSKKLSAATVSNMTKSIQVEREAWEKRPLSPRYLAIFIDALHIKLRRETVETDAVYLAYGITETGYREVLGMYLGAAESSIAWQQWLSDLKARGVKEVLLFVMDGLTQLTETVKAVFPQALTQRCVVHQVRQSLTNVRVKHRAEMAEDLKTIYHCQTEAEAKTTLIKLKFKWRRWYPRLFTTWENYLPEFMAFLHFPPLLRKYLYTTNWLERLNKELRKVVKTKNSFPTEEAVRNLLFLKLKDLQDKWESRRLPSFDTCRLEINNLWESRYPHPVTQST